MNNDLISRSELKKVIETYRSNECFNDLQRGKNKMIDCCLAEIDHAPTVEAKTVADCIIAYGDGYETARRLNERPQDNLIKAFELLKAYCKNRECNKDCVFYRELRVGDNTEQFCVLCEIVTSDD